MHGPTWALPTEPDEGPEGRHVGDDPLMPRRSDPHIPKRWPFDRKTSGSFYTPRAVTDFVVRRTLGPLVEGRSSQEILQLRIVDPAMGSGAFLVAACRYLASRAEEALVAEGAWPEFDVPDEDRAELRRTIAERCIYGVDLTANYKEKDWSAYANLGTTHARAKQVETGQFNFEQDELDFIASNWVHLDHEQKLSASAGVNVRVGDGYAVGASALFGSGLRNGFANTTHLPSYTTVNADLSKRLDLGGGGPVEARLSVVNLFDKVYQLRDGSGIGVGAPQYGQRRTVYVSLTKEF